MCRIRTLIMKQWTLFFFEQNARTILLIYQNWMRYVTLAKCLRIVTGATGSICLKQKLCKYVDFVFIDVNLSLFSHRFIVWDQSLAREQVLKLWQETVMIRNNKKKLQHGWLDQLFFYYVTSINKDYLSSAELKKTLLIRNN